MGVVTGLVRIEKDLSLIGQPGLVPSGESSFLEAKRAARMPARPRRKNPTRCPTGPVTSHAALRSGRRSPPEIAASAHPGHAIVALAMAASLTTTKQDLDDSRVRVEVEVEPSAVEHEVEGAARSLAGDMKVPAFARARSRRPWSSSAWAVEAVLDEAVRRALPGWYGQAVQQEHIATVGDPR